MPEHAGHLPVLLDRVLELLAPAEGETYLDLTIGRGGHAEAMARRIGPTGHTIGFDLDPQNLDFARRRLMHVESSEHESSATSTARDASTPTPDPRPPTPELFHAPFTDAPAILAQHGWAADMILADLGFASTQMVDPQRGFSFRADGPLDMRLNPLDSLTAAELVNESAERELADLIYRYGEEPLSRKIAATIVAERKHRPINTTARLAELVVAAYGPRARFSRMHPATRTFQALRIAVNDELGRLEEMWRSITEEVPRIGAAKERSGSDGGGWMRPGARIVFISFHSLEDRIVKRAMADLAARGLAQRLTRKPRTARPEEVERNPRARSAKLRAIRLTSETTDQHG